MAKWWLLLTGLLASIAGTSHADPIQLDVTFKLTDQDYQPLANRTVRIAFSGQDWQSPDAGQRVTTDAQGTAHFTATVTLDQQTQWRNIGFTPFSWPSKTDHLLIAAEMERVLPVDGKDQTFHWLYTENIFHFASGETSGGYVDAIFTKDASGRFTRRLEPNLGNLQMAQRSDLEDRAIAGDEGYVPADFGLDVDESDPAHPHWTLSLAFKEMPPPIRQ